MRDLSNDRAVAVEITESRVKKRVNRPRSDTVVLEDILNAAKRTPTELPGNVKKFENVRFHNRQTVLNTEDTV